MRRKCAGATLLEFAVAASVLGALAWVLLDRLAYYQEWAEKANMEYTAAALKSALRMEFSTLMMEGRMRELPALARQNPMDWLARKPANYLGEFGAEPPAAQARGAWYYDRGARVLVYRLKEGRYFVPDSRGRKEVRFRTVLVYDNYVGNSSTEGSLMVPSGIKLSQIETYRWF